MILADIFMYERQTYRKNIPISSYYVPILEGK